MILILRERCGGKTHEAIKIAAKENAYMVVHSKAFATHIFQEAKRIGLDIPFPITFKELITGHYGPGVERIVIDDLDLLLGDLVHKPGGKSPKIVAITATAYTNLGERRP